MQETSIMLMVAFITEMMTNFMYSFITIFSQPFNLIPFSFFNVSIKYTLRTQNLMCFRENTQALSIMKAKLRKIKLVQQTSASKKK